MSLDEIANILNKKAGPGRACFFICFIV